MTRPATPLPWVVVGDGLTHVDIYSSSNQQGGPPFCVRSSNSRQDASYIVHAANSLPNLEAEIKRLETAQSQLIDERDGAEEALSQAFYLVVGRSPEWSNQFGKNEAIEEIDSAQYVLRAEIERLRKALEGLRINGLVAESRIWKDFNARIDAALNPKGGTDDA